jgi:predicted Mrr-cat superfamily restriction endonuclease
MQDKLQQVIHKLITIEDSLYKLHYASSIVALVAQSNTDNDQSGSLWAASDLINALQESVEQQLQETRSVLFDLKQAVPAPKKRGRPAKKGKK